MTKTIFVKLKKTLSYGEFDFVVAQFIGQD